jgi:hypothetical protein
MPRLAAKIHPAGRDPLYSVSCLHPFQAEIGAQETPSGFPPTFYHVGELSPHAITIHMWLLTTSCRPLHTVGPKLDLISRAEFLGSLILPHLGRHMLTYTLL